MTTMNTLKYLEAKQNIEHVIFDKTIYNLHFSIK